MIFFILQCKICMKVINCYVSNFFVVFRFFVVEV